MTRGGRLSTMAANHASTAAGSFQPTRLQGTLTALANGELANAPTRRKLVRIVRLAADTFEDCFAAATVRGHDGEVCTNHAAYHLDQAQYRSGTGPGPLAMQSRRAVRVDSITSCSWTEFRRAAAENRIASSLSLPLVHDGVAIGVLNLYSPQAGAFASCEAAAAILATAAARLLGATGPRPRR